MTRLEWSEKAVSGLDQLILSHSLPKDTRARIEKSAHVLRRFRRFGPELEERPDGSELRFLIGPWPWRVIVYLHLEADNRAVIVSIEDGRAAGSTITIEKGLR